MEQWISKGSVTARHSGDKQGVVVIEWRTDQYNWPALKPLPKSDLKHIQDGL